jgi:glutamyl-tRNA synthetase
MSVITRFPPSPTGLLHVGGARTALFNYLYAKQHGGKFILRIEDTDHERSKKEYENEIVESLRWLGIVWDNAEVWRSSERGETYQSYLTKLIDSGAAYVSREPEKRATPPPPASLGAPPHEKEEGKMVEVVRFRNPNKRVGWKDMIRGDVSFDTTELKDFVIARSVSEPLYHLAVVVDDFEMGITHIIRGEDHISNTARQMLIQEALGAPAPRYAHLPLVLAADRSKLSKRKHAELASLAHYRSQGISPEAMVNFLALLGWHPSESDASEVLSLSDLLREFRLERVQKGGAVLDVNKLNWLNRQYLKRKGKAV